MTYTKTNGANSLKLACKALRNKERDEGGRELREAEIAERDHVGFFFTNTKIGFRHRVFI